MRSRKSRYGLGVLLLILTVAPPWDARAQGNYRVLHAFTGGSADGCLSYAGLLFDAAGKLYGTTVSCGVYDYGTAFQLDPGKKWKEVILHDFGSDGNDGRGPWAGLIFGPTGTLYGTTEAGGSFGTVFELAPSSGGRWIESVLYSFDIYNGQPFAGLVLDEAGNVYGTTQQNTVYKLTHSSGGDWKETTIYGFTAKGDGGSPEAGLTWDKAGNLYSTTAFGGAITKSCYGCGTVFELSPTSGGGWKEHVLYRFKWIAGSNHDGLAPYAGVIFDSAGNLYGTTAGGGDNGCQAGCGTVFKLTPLSNGRWKHTTLHSFHLDRDGYAPFGGLVMDKAGNLYGTTTWDGVNNAGTVFKLAPGSNGKWNYSVLHRFAGPDGAQSYAGLIFDKSGKHLYGTTAYGGAGGYGVVFEITP
jgi:uncharacterized repeat protein (TIGR03803 family)